MISFLTESWFPAKRNGDFQAPDKWWILPRIIHGDFQMMLSDFDEKQLFYTIPDFHDTRKRYAKLKADVVAVPCGRVAEVREELDWLLSVEDEAYQLTNLYNAGKLPLRVTHNVSA